MSTDVIIKTQNVNMYFGSTHANNNISIEVKRGEIRGFAGENGSGKSTLMSLLSGIYIKTNGHIWINDREYLPKSPNDALKSKIGIVVQELGMINSLSNAVNIFLPRLEEFSRAGYISLNEVHKQASLLLEKWGIKDIPLKKTAGQCSVEIRKMLELSRALSADPDIIILDEVTQALSHNNRDLLYQIMGTLKEKGKTILFVSHDLQEMIDLTDSITVLKDGSVVGTYSSSELHEDELKRLMIGRDLKGHFYREDQEPMYSDEVVLDVKNLICPGNQNKGKGVSFALHKGEILAMCGLSDSGMHEIGEAIYGVIPNNKGSVYLRGADKYIQNCRQSVKNRIAYVPKDRDNTAMMLNASIKHNLCLPSIRHMQRFLKFVSPVKMKRFANEAIEEYDVKCKNQDQPTGDLSGGNKQKINLGRWFKGGMDVFIMDSPTRGVDIGVKAYIYDLMIKAKRNGQSILLIADELTEAIGMADRILILKEGEIAGTVTRGQNFTEESIIKVMV